jgi:hypothetical protein
MIPEVRSLGFKADSLLDTPGSPEKVGQGGSHSVASFRTAVELVMRDQKLK